MFGQKQRKTERHLNFCVAVFFVAMFLLGAVFSGSYGMPWDEKEEQTILNANMREYLHCFDLERLIPEFTDKEVSYRISSYYEKDHGIASYYPIGMFILHRDSYPTRLVSFVWQSYTYCLNFLGILALYGLVRELLGGRLLGMLTASVFFFSPRMFAEMHYNNKDMVCLTLVLLTLYFGVRWIKSHRMRDAVPFAIAGAFAANARLIAAFAFGLVGGIYLLLFLRDAYGKHPLSESVRKERFRHGLLTILVCGISYVLITPAMWLQPVAFVRHLISNTINFARWDGKVLFDGVAYRHQDTPLPRGYLPTMIGITTPIYVLVLIVIGTASIWIRAVRDKFDSTETVLPAMVSVMWLFPMLLAVGLNTHIYNGWRQFYFIYGPMVFCAAAGLLLLQQGFKRFGKMGLHIGTGLLAVCLAVSAVGIIRNQPYEFGYCNALAGKNAERRYELDYWHLSSGPLVQELFEETEDRETTVFGFVTVYGEHAAGWARKLLPPEQQECMHIEADIEKADYVLLNLTYLHTVSAEINPLTPLEGYLHADAEETEELVKLRYLLENFHERSRSVSYNNTMMVLYERNDASN